MFSVFKVLHKSGNLHINRKVKTKILNCMLIRYNIVFKMSFEASNAEPLASQPSLALSEIWVDINDKKLRYFRK